MPRPRLRRVNGQVDNSCLVMVKVLDPPPDPQCIKATSQLGGSVLRSAVPTWASRNRAHCFTPPDSSQAPNPGEWPPGPGFGAAESPGTAIRAALDAATASRTMKGEEDGCMHSSSGRRRCRG